jgi:hypothetical protein
MLDVGIKASWQCCHPGRRAHGDAKAIKNNRPLRPKTGEVLPERAPPHHGGGRYTLGSKRGTWAVIPWKIHFF